MRNTAIKLSREMREALYFRNISFKAKLDSEANVSKYGISTICLQHCTQSHKLPQT